MTSGATTTATRPKAPEPPPQFQEYVHRAAWKAGVMGAFNVLTKVLAVRLTLLLSVGGAFWLSWTALAQPDVLRLAVLGVYSVVVVVPLVVLAARG